MSDHTPAPWTVEHRHALATTADDEMDGLGLEVRGPEQPMLRGQYAKAADAWMAAAAPELFNALKTAESALALAASYVHHEQRTMHAAIDTARAAIAKARGENAGRKRPTDLMAGSVRDWDFVQ